LINLVDKIKSISAKIIERMESKMYKKQLKFGIKENIELLKVTSIRFVYLIELSTSDQ
jgi:hypothetical protein